MMGTIFPSLKMLGIMLCRMEKLKNVCQDPDGYRLGCLICLYVMTSGPAVELEFLRSIAGSIMFKMKEGTRSLLWRHLRWVQSIFLS